MRIGVIMSDQRMPDLSGPEFFSRVKDMYPHSVRIVLSGYTDLESLTGAVNRGAIYKFILKPWEPALLVQTLDEAFLQYEKAKAGRLLYDVGQDHRRLTAGKRGVASVQRPGAAPPPSS